MEQNKFIIELKNISSSKISAVINDFNKFYVDSLKLVKELNGLDTQSNGSLEHKIISPYKIELISRFDKENLIIFFNFGIYLGYYIYLLNNDISIGVISDKKNIKIYEDYSIFIQIGLPEALFIISEPIKLEYNLSINIIGNYEVPVCKLNGNLSSDLLFHLGYQLPFEEDKLDNI